MNNKATYVLIHGGWHGSGCWNRRPELNAFSGRFVRSIKEHDPQHACALDRRRRWISSKDIGYNGKGGGTKLLAMSKLFESAGSRMIAEVQRIGGDIDPQLLSWPGGYFIAVSVCLYTRVAVFTRDLIERRSRANSRTCDDYRTTIWSWAWVPARWRRRSILPRWRTRRCCNG
jgi:hypothetical protein